jgi:GTP cyclohydrolase III
MARSDQAMIQFDLNVGVGLTDAARKAGIQADLNVGIGPTDASRKAGIQSDVNPRPARYSGGSGNMPIGPGLDSR